jgi:phage terminase large subunit-like protein
MPRRVNGPVTSADVLRFFAKHIRIPEGPRVGQPLRLAEWQRRELEKIYDNPANTRLHILSVARKNSKTTLCAALMLNHLVGPSARSRPNAQLFSSALSRDQASLVFNAAVKMIKLDADLSRAVTIRETRKELFCGELGVTYRALAADSTTALGLNPSFVVHDELGSIEGPRSPLYDALELASGAQQNPLSLVISTQSASDADLLSTLIDDALGGADPRITCSLYTAPKDRDPFDVETIKLANPGYGEILNPVEIRGMAEAARRLPAREMEYRRYVLNQRTELASPFVARDVLESCIGEPAPLAELPVLYGGLDLSSVSDLTALVLIGLKGGKWHVHCRFWLPGEGLKEKSAADRETYDLWHQKGYLSAAPGRTVSYEHVAHELRHLFREHNIRRIAFDAWNWRNFKPWLSRAGFSEPMLAERFEEFRQGTASMSGPLRELEEAMLSGRLVYHNPVLSMCLANAVIRSDSAGNRAFDKSKARRRIDGAVALAMAFGAAPSAPPPIDISSLIG